MLALQRFRKVREPEVQPERLYRAEELIKPALMLAVVVLMVVGSALMVIFASHDYRKLFHQHQVTVREYDELQVEWGQLLLEQGAWAANNRVESLVVKKLNMKVPDPTLIEFVRDE
ncbi:MAG: cell division protein FtsL [Oceanospirillaceae bacterium]|nr:cell division protein FtsL [Oceanospirillaceae bacterium]